VKEHKEGHMDSRIWRCHNLVFPCSIRK